MSALPAWMTTPAPQPQDSPSRRGHSRSAFVRHALARLARALATQLAPARADGWLSGFDARAKILATLLLIIAASLARSLPALAAAAVLALALALVAGLRGRRLLPLWLGVPLFTLALALPACLNLVTPGQPLLVLWTTPPVAVTDAGLVVAARLFLRALACVAFALTLTGTTPSSSLVNGLRRLGLPRVFGMILTMMQRYLVLVLRKAEDLHLARLSRGYGGETMRQGRQWAAAGIGVVFLSSLRLAQGVHDAMVSRGYDGDIRVLEGPRWGLREGLLVLAGLVVAGLLLLWDRWAL